ncbi:MAG: IS66 family insertion sequence element accessory protein TnpB [Candidatus Obscuribacterales bacterium]
MIAPNNTRIFLCTEDTDMRKSFSALSGIVRRAMNLDPLSGYLFVFRNKRADRIKLLYWDRDGLAIWYKALQKGTFRFPDLKNISSAGVEIEASMLRLILDGIDLRSIRRQQRFHLNPGGKVEHELNPAAALYSDGYKPPGGIEPK